MTVRSADPVIRSCEINSFVRANLPRLAQCKPDYILAQLQEQLRSDDGYEEQEQFDEAQIRKALTLN